MLMEWGHRKLSLLKSVVVHGKMEQQVAKTSFIRRLGNDVDDKSIVEFITRQLKKLNQFHTKSKTALTERPSRESEDMMHEVETTSVGDRGASVTCSGTHL